MDRETSRAFVNGKTGSRTYGRSDNLPTAVTAIGSDSAATLSYTYDSNKNPESESAGGSMANYSWTSDYDNEDRLVDYDWTTGYSQDWTLTGAGDWDATTANSVVQERSHSAGHKSTQLTSGGTTLTYDLKGNLTADANGQAYAWDFDNLLTSITTPTSTGHTFKYDVYGRRVWRAVTPSGGSTTTTGFVLASAAEGGQVMAEVAPMSAGTVVTRKFIWGEYVDDPLVQIVVSGSETKYYHHTNRMFSTVAITDSTGAVVERYAYTAYGEPTILNAAASSTLSASTIGNRTLYTGREWEPEAKVYYYRARYYEPKMGRFLGRDPIEYGSDAFSLYLYTDNRPITFLDPTGHKKKIVDIEQCTVTIIVYVDIDYYLIEDPETYSVTPEDWTDDRKAQFKKDFETNVEAVWNNHVFAFYPHKDKHRGCACPCSSLGIRPVLDIQIGEYTWADVRVSAYFGSPPDGSGSTQYAVFGHSGSMTISAGDVDPSAGTQNTAAHEFGHAAFGLFHPGASFGDRWTPGWFGGDPNRARSYEADSDALMGDKGNEIREEYLEEWNPTDSLRHDGCGPYHIGVTGFP